MSREHYLGRLLIVDDDEATCAFWRVALGNEGFRVEVAHDLESMKEIVRRYSVDAILLDLDLGKDQGLDGLPFILAESPFSKVFILTANATVNSAVKALQSGASGYITKDTPPQPDCIANS